MKALRLEMRIGDWKKLIHKTEILVGQGTNH